MSSPGTARRAQCALLLVVVMVLCGCAGSTDGARIIQLDRPMPALAGPTIAGQRIEADAFDGKVVVINFWASWCDPCRREQPGLESLWRRNQGKGVVFVGVNYKDAPGPAASYLSRFGVTYPSVADPKGSIGERFGIPSLPATILINTEGRMRYLLVGAQDSNFVGGLIQELTPAIDSI